MLIKGINVLLYEDPNEPEIVSNVLIGEPFGMVTEQDADTSQQTLGYILAIPKNDRHDWSGKRVDFFGQSFRTLGLPTQGIDSLIPLDWNKKIKAVLMKVNGTVTIFEKGTFGKHKYSAYSTDSRSFGYSGVSGEKVNGELTAVCYLVNEYIPKAGDLIVFADCELDIDTSSEKTTSVSLAQLRRAYPNYAVIYESSKKGSGKTIDVIVRAK